jgi:photosystem II stability/assembly factor-like uncharacterized protein
MALSVSHGGRTVTSANGPSNELLIGTVDGIVFLSRSQRGAPWSESRRALEGKHISALMITPDGTLFAGAHKDDGGIQVSSDGGKTWEPRNEGLQSRNVYSMNYVEADGGLRVFAGTEPAHLHRSTDLGQHWEDLPAIRDVPTVDQWTFPGPPHIAHVKHINFDPRDPEIIYASIEVGGALKSEDGGKTWRDLPGVYEDVHRIIIPPTQPDRLYVTGGKGVWYSGDAGQNWTHLNEAPATIAYPDGLVVHPENANLVFTSGGFCQPGGWRTARTANSRIARSRDAGQNWDYLTGGLPDHIHGNIEALVIEVWPGGSALAAANTDGDVFYSDDEGDTWSVIARGLPAVSKGGHYRNIPGPEEPELVGAR